MRISTKNLQLLIDK